MDMLREAGKCECILIRTALSFLEGFAVAHINLGSCQSSSDQLTNVLTSGGKLSQNIKQTTFAVCSSLEYYLQQRVLENVLNIEEGRI